MDQVKIGKFISERRKKANLTQMQLAEKLNITDRAVSKWETGKAMPDTSIMLDLCDVLGISVNDLLCGEVISMENYNKNLENNLLEMADWLRVVLIIGGFVPFAIGIVYALRIEQVAGYYECAKCGHRYVPTYRSVFFAPHINRTRHMRCPKCGKRSWQKKVLNKE